MCYALCGLQCKKKKEKVDATHRDTKHKLLPEKVSSSLVFKGNSLTEALLLTEKLLTGCVEKKKSNLQSRNLSCWKVDFKK